MERELQCVTELPRCSAGGWKWGDLPHNVGAFPAHRARTLGDLSGRPDAKRSACGSGACGPPAQGGALCGTVSSLQMKAIEETVRWDGATSTLA